MVFSHCSTDKENQRAVAISNSIRGYHMHVHMDLKTKTHESLLREL